MNILIVEDHEELGRVLVESLVAIDHRAEPRDQIVAIWTARDVETAAGILPRCSAVLCDGRFLATPEAKEPSENWMIIASHAARHGVRFILYSADEDALRMARLCGLAAFAKPTPVETLYAVLMGRGEGDPLESRVEDDLGAPRAA